ncbi:MAG: NAD(P)H dehydrogenase [Microbacterium sp. SCN 70-200]|uniref:NAD(P)H-dependent oxidoreductase n=1 Tax=unclassified Microbacterium TaxID=2609290 RepID=UPI00086A7485|nr:MULTISPECIES: NAD(P)H-dependent oxidoreductase [unclassified Microbacterium]MBN9213763.1 NAD(P)H-dependent oxidoreductase [Microbacterium sp.]ODT42323.1 MAG: NAD(P)H dehydrogenase [Microbacterium sp. SCN 70-200]OJV85549.1 MAG: NAD(P)H dehydrogenase [Microbacterium sp. 70-16]
MTAQILVVVGTPIADSLNHALADAYVDSARAGGAEVRVIDLAVDPIPAHPRHRDELRAPRSDADRPLDPDVARYIDDVRWADHLVVFHPQWWGTVPAALKAFIDRVFLSGSAFRYREKSLLSERLLTGRTARVVMTMDSPTFWNRLVYRGAAEASLTRATFGYCGVKTVGITRFTPVRFSTAPTRAQWIAQTATLGRKDAARIAPRDQVEASVGA